jgi:hypothetical protein
MIGKNVKYPERHRAVNDAMTTLRRRAAGRRRLFEGPVPVTRRGVLADTRPAPERTSAKPWFSGLCVG